VLVLAGFGAGLINGIAGGGSLVSFPALLLLGHSAIVANVTSTVGIWPGYLGGVAGFRRELAAQRPRVVDLLPPALAGGLVGAVLLLVTPSDLFRALAPGLVLVACLLFAVQPRLLNAIRSRDRPPSARRTPLSAALGTFGAAIYGGYFGAGLGVILLAVLGLALDDDLGRINGLRGVLALSINSVALVLFAVRAEVAWGAAALLAVTSLFGGYTGARVARRLPAPVLRKVVIALGLAAAARMLTS
jgi:uncharacterized membrane protein YfcA